MMRGLLLAGLLVGCAASPAPEDAPRPPSMDEPVGETCNAARVQGHGGNRLSDALERNILGESRAEQVRVIRPGESYTMDHRADRLNIRVDEQGRITAISCG